jgi:hypothetical protein
LFKSEFPESLKGNKNANIMPHRWTSVEELMAHSKLDYSAKMSDQIQEFTTKFEFKMSKVFAGFDSKN